MQKDCFSTLPTGRFAPSPTGRMHLGNVFGALLSWLSAKSKGGQWLLRIEDIDPQRSRREYALQLMDDLQWLGLSWDGEPVYQSERGDIYEQYFKQLKAQGLTYPCYCTRADLLATQAPHESDGRVVYPGTCRPKTIGTIGTIDTIDTIDTIGTIKTIAAAQRLIVPDREIAFTDGHYGAQSINLASHVGDFIIRRKDGAWAYQLAVVIDDALMGVNEVVRGRDLLLSSPQQIYVGELLGFHAPAFIHFPLLVNEAGQRLSKRDRSLDMGELRQRHTPQEIIGMLAFHAGLQKEPQPVSTDELIKKFAWQQVPCEDITIRNLSI